MIGGFLRGIFGTALLLATGIAFVAMIAAGMPAGLVLVLSASMIVMGKYLRYASRQTVRVRR